MAAIILSTPMLQALKKELKHFSPNIKVEDDFLRATLQNEVLKREVADSDEAKQAATFIQKVHKTPAKPKVIIEAVPKPAVIDNDKIVPITKTTDA